MTNSILLDWLLVDSIGVICTVGTKKPWTLDEFVCLKQLNLGLFSNSKDSSSSCNCSTSASSSPDIQPCPRPLRLHRPSGDQKQKFQFVSQDCPCKQFLRKKIELILGWNKFMKIVFLFLHTKTRYLHNKTSICWKLTI